MNERSPERFPDVVYARETPGLFLGCRKDSKQS
jgi:hypothetical protein